MSLENSLPLGLAPVAVQGARSYADGTFELEAFPGMYRLTASDPKTGKASNPLELHLRDQDIANLELELSDGYQIHGSLIVDGLGQIEFSKLHVSLGGGSIKPNNDGTFKTNLPGGKGVYLVQNLPEGWYVKQVSLGGRPLTSRLFELGPGTSELTFVLSPRGARVEVIPEGAEGSLQAVYVLLLPEEGPLPDVDALLTAYRNEAGKFILPAVPPGTYRVFTFDASTWVLMMNPQSLLDKYRATAPVIHIAEGEHRAITIPASKPKPE